MCRQERVWTSQPLTTHECTYNSIHLRDNSASHDLFTLGILDDDMAKINKLYTFGILCIGMGIGSTAVNKIMKPDMSIPVPKTTTTTTSNQDNDKN
ncbi:hypothetical protein O0I10_001716 [Lichtheimia ornata]|uniref:Uncharacterized protein n=1 Tax=Lichtheimia ornata TaxID=688661 RepID=A0AAD7Y2W5_9FUNG|nr:uncharacterized protein O0I10_001716 [Lichtheimia ornata]KAJ8662752.1 hypothetical protein O0I10_001716 [Lichtheimia ornata]